MYCAYLSDHKVNIIHAVSYWDSLAFLRLLLPAAVISNGCSAFLIGERILEALDPGWVQSVSTDFCTQGYIAAVTF